jgi:putative transposase
MSAMRETHRRLYNDALAERKQAWEQEQRSVSYAEQSGQLKAARTTTPFLAVTNFSSCQATLRRLDKAFQAFFRRVKAGQTAGYPRFKGRNRFDTVEFPSYGDGCRFDGRCVYF